MTFIKVTWIDAADLDNEKLDKIMAKPTKYFGVIRESYGILLKEDEHGYIIGETIDPDKGDVEGTFIPKGWVKGEVEYFDDRRNSDKRIKAKGFSKLSNEFWDD